MSRSPNTFWLQQVQLIGEDKDLQQKHQNKREIPSQNYWMGVR